jgi:hypothetical protein
MDFARYLGEAPPPSIILNVHAAVFVLWLGLVTLQVLWVEIGNLRRHKQLGWLTVAVSAVMVPLGLAAALVDQVRQVTHPDYAPQFLALEFQEMIAFSVFMTAGVIFRRFSFSSPWGYGICGVGDAFIQRCCSAQPSFGQARSSRPFSISHQHGARSWFG